MEKKIRILMVLGNTGRGGAQTFAINVLRMINREKFQVDFAVNEIRENGYTQEIYDLGSEIFAIPFFKGYNWLSYVRKWNELLANNHYAIVHGHVSSSATIYLEEARRHGCKTIVHSHSAGFRGNGIVQQIKKVFTLGAKKKADYWFACSRPAAERLFGLDYLKYEHFFFIPNAIIAENYLFNANSRNRIRSELGISNDQKLYGHVGSFTTPKNHGFLLDVFSIIASKDPGAVLVLCGEGEKKEEIQDKIRSVNLEGRITFVGNVSNVNEYMMAMDTMIFPSFFEGFPITVLEAQATGLPIILSDTITDEVFLTDCIYPMSLNESIVDWVDKAMTLKASNREKNNRPIADSKYNMRNCVQLLERLYSEMADKI